MSSRVVVPSSVTSNNNQLASDTNTKEERLGRAREIAIRHALSIEEKKNLHNKVLDMIVTAYDLPSSDLATPASPNPADVLTFQQCLALFRPADLDEVVSERNIDDRCGYALCKRPNLKQPPKKVWNAKGRLVEKKTDGQWCSRECRDRNTFVWRQLSDEPAWLRQDQSQQITLLMDGPQPIANAPTIIISQATENDHKEEKLKRESDHASAGSIEDIAIVEKEHTKAPEPPSMINNDVLEGLPVRTIGQRRKRAGG